MTRLWSAGNWSFEKYFIIHVRLGVVVCLLAEQWARGKDTAWNPHIVWDGLALAWRGEGMAVSSRYLYQVFLVVLCIVFILTSAFPFVFVWETHTHTHSHVCTHVCTRTHTPNFVREKLGRLQFPSGKKRKKEKAPHTPHSMISQAMLIIFQGEHNKTQVICLQQFLLIFTQLWIIYPHGKQLP